MSDDYIKKDAEQCGLDCDKYYGQVFYCSNCGRSQHRYIRKGIRKINISFDCDYCGCVVRG